MGICLACIGYYILVRVVGIIHLQWTTNGKYCIGVGIGGKTNDNRSMAKYVDDVVAWDHQPYKKRDKETNTRSRRWWANSTILCKSPTNIKGVSRLHVGNGLIMIIA